MKMVKSLLLVSAAGIVATAGAQAADLPVKAKPVEYVKVCSLYGAGFYYIPGTDICMKVGGYVRYQLNAGTGNNITSGPLNGTGGANNRNVSSDLAQRTRAIATFDTRQQTAYGTLRTYLLMGFTHDSTSFGPGPSPAVYFTRGFIQIAGFTFGKATSFFDFVSTAAVAYNAGFLASSDTGDTGQMVGSYTAQFGNGFSGTIGIEESRRYSTALSSAYTAAQVFANPGGDNLGGVGGAAGAASAPGTASRPDIVGNIRLDQAWGSAQVSGALHDVSMAYYTAANQASGHADDKWGWAVSGGLRLNAPMFGPGDYFQGVVIYSQGATKYADYTPSSATSNKFSGDSFGFGTYEDAVVGASPVLAGSINLTTAFSVMASYEHFWTPSLRTSIYGSYVDISHNAQANAIICNGGGFGGTGLVGSFVGLGAATQCNADFQVWNIGSRSQWNVTKDFYVGVDVIYQKLQSASINNGAPVAFAATPGNGIPAGAAYHTADQDAVSVTWRAHRDIVP